MHASAKLPRVVSQSILNPTIESLLEGKVEFVNWDTCDMAESPIDGIYCYGHRKVDAALMDRFPNLKVISNHGVGVDHIDLDAARQRGIPVGNTPGVLDGAVADLAFSLLLAAARRLAEGDRYARRPDVVAFATGERHGRDVHGATLGIVGLGNIGSQIAKRARGFDMQILYHNRTPRSVVEKDFIARWVTLDDLLTESDFVVLIVPLTDATRNMISYRELALMKPTATLVNIARGGVVDTQALTETMLAKKIFAAALDVTEPEPLPRDHPLLSLNNVTLTPHLGSATVQTRRKMAELSVENLLAGLAGKPLVERIA
ncbi:MAG: D-glycerate dehydrogenase [Pirellulaceae bacterium]|nr:D-glycerate dehydrogenase [Pirellulaceae bacterium]